MPGHRRVHRHHDARKLRQHVNSCRLKCGLRPQRPLGALQKFSVQFLTPQPRTGVAAAHLGQERRRQISPVGLGRRMGDHGRRIGQYRFQHADIARRGGHHLARSTSQPQTELQHVPGRLRLLPLGQLINPGRVKLRAPQRLGLVRRKRLRCGPVRPFQQLAPGFPVGPAVRRRARQYAAFAKNHHFAHLLDGLANQSDAARAPRIQRQRALDLAAHPLSPGAGFSGATPAHDHPGAPVASRSHLVVQCPELEQIGQRQQRPLPEIIQKPVLNLARRAGKPFGV